MQPDFLFTAKGQVVSIEMKVKAKCSVDQVLKYALLGLAVEIKEQIKKEHYLILLAKEPFASLFRPRLDCFEELLDAVGNANLSAFLKNKPRHLREQQDRFNQIVAEMQLRFVTYKFFAETLGDAVPPESDKASCAEVYRNLVSGLTAEFRRRQLL